MRIEGEAASLALDLLCGLSMGTNSDGKRQEVFEQPDGTRVTIVSGPTGALVTVRFPDGSTDGFKTP